MVKLITNCAETTTTKGTIKKTLRIIHVRVLTKTKLQTQQPPTIRYDNNITLLKQMERNAMVHYVVLQMDYHGLMLRQPEQFLCYLKTTQHAEEPVKSLNSRRQTLLHVACKHNRSEFIIPLLIKACDPAKQDTEGHTALHIALEHRHIECIIEFLNYMENPTLYDPQCNTNHTVQRLKDMFRFYTHTGYTIIHLSVLQNLPEILTQFLKFCIKHKIDVLQSEVLGCGDSLLHLAVKNQLLDIARIIVELIPESLRIRNYPGALAYDIEPITEKMRGLLKQRGKRLSIK